MMNPPNGKLHTPNTTSNFFYAFSSLPSTSFSSSLLLLLYIHTKWLSKAYSIHKYEWRLRKQKNDKRPNAKDKKWQIHEVKRKQYNTMNSQMNSQKVLLYFFFFSTSSSSNNNTQIEKTSTNLENITRHKTWSTGKFKCTENTELLLLLLLLLNQLY